MAGFIAITTPEWIKNIRSMQVDTAVFWNKKTSFKAITQGEPFYFLRRGSFTSNSERFISGRGIFKGFQKLEPYEAWTRYGKLLGFLSKKEFEEKISNFYKGKTGQLGCIVLDKVEFFAKELSLEECSIVFSPYIVSGKKLTDVECIQIESKSKE